jgi:hypothetical protein
MMTPQRAIWILRACLHAAIQLARTDDHVQVSNQPREDASDMAGKWCVDAPNSVAGDRFRRLRLLIRPQTRRKNMSNPTKHQDRGTGATPASGAKAGATQGTFMTSDAIPWKPIDPSKPDGVQMFVVWGNPKEGASGILLKFPAGTDAGWHWHTAPYYGVVIQGKATHTVKGAAPQTGGPDPCGRNLRDRSMMTSAKRAATA